MVRNQPALEPALKTAGTQQYKLSDQSHLLEFQIRLWLAFALDKYHIQKRSVHSGGLK